ARRVADAYALDTNIYIRALRDPRRLRALKRFTLRAGLRLKLSAVVALELRAGARTRAQEVEVDRLIGAFVDANRVLTPAFDAYTQTGRVLAALGTRYDFGLLVTRSFVNDILLAASCRAGATVLVTENARDF